MKKLFFLIILLISYGSLYPFDFTYINFADSIHRMFPAEGGQTSHIGDILANIIIFVPFGFTGYFAFSGSPVFRHVLLVISGILLGFGLQILQVYLPSRDPNIFDAILNVFGTFAGTIAASSSSILYKKTTGFKVDISVPLLLITCWFAYKLMPFVPSLDWQEIKNSVKPVFLEPVFDWLSFSHALVAWLLVFFLSAQIHLKRYLLLLLLACFSLEILIVNNVVTLANVTGGLAAYAIWLPLSTSRYAPHALFLALSILLPLNGLMPFTATAPDLSNSFHWLPFSGFLGNSMLFNTMSFFEKFFFYGSYIWLLYNIGLSLVWAAIIAFFFFLVIEIGQLYVSQHTAEITDPLLALMIAFTFHLLMQKTTQNLDKAPVSAYTITIIPLTTMTARQMPQQGLQIPHMPFKVGRASIATASEKHHGDFLELQDYSPFQLSRDHFMILIKKGKPVLRDCKSTLGTIVNGISCPEQKNREVTLRLGNNEVVAGKSRVDFRFNVQVSLLDSAAKFVPDQIAEFN